MDILFLLLYNMLMKLRNLFLVFRDQLPVSRLWRNLRSGNIRGLLHPRSHRTHAGNVKVMYGSRPTAERAAESMRTKTGNYFSTYKCLYCDGYHVGKNRNPDGSPQQPF